MVDTVDIDCEVAEVGVVVVVDTGGVGIVGLVVVEDPFVVVARVVVSTVVAPVPTVVEDWELDVD